MNLGIQLRLQYIEKKSDYYGYNGGCTVRNKTEGDAVLTVRKVVYRKRATLQGANKNKKDDQLINAWKSRLSRGFRVVCYDER